jgi:hypothetical protein
VTRVFATGYTYSTMLIDLTLTPGHGITGTVIGSRTV